MRDKFIRFMYGRNGTDNLSRFLTWTSLVLVVIQLLIGGKIGAVLWYAAVVLLIYAYFRMFSKNLAKRRAENQKFLVFKNRFLSEFRNRRERLSQRKDYKFFKCPSCRAVLRVPRGKGRIRVTCRKCGNAFEAKS